MAFKTVRGMQDFLPERAAKKKWIEDCCRTIFESYGFLPLETPIVEEFGLLAKKGSGGEAIKEEIYYFKDKSKRELGLRVDLTVPLARVVANNPQLAKPFKRYAIGRVYRYDRPQSKRWREFTQADWDILGSSSQLADFEIIAVAIDAMKALGFKDEEFKVKINNRKLLEEMAVCCKVNKGKVVECFRCLDKLEKIGEKEVEKELKEKGINTQILGQLRIKDLEKLKLKNTAPLKEVQRLMKLLEAEGLGKFVELDLGLARGLEYYTGTVFEVKLKDGPSVGGGGRYDKLVELYGGQKTPAVGCSFGVERLLDALEKRIKLGDSTRVFVAPIGEKAVGKALSLTQQIRLLGVSAEIDLMQRSVGKNIQYAEKKGIPFFIALGENEIKEKKFRIKELKTGKETEVNFSELEKLKELV